MTRVASCDAARLGRAVAEHLAGHDAAVEPVSETVWTLASRHGTARIMADSGLLRIEASAPDAEALMEMKYLLASHVGEFNTQTAADIVWRGDGEEIAVLPNVRTLAVSAVRDLSPHIRRITFASTGLKRFDTLSALHVKLLLPQEGSPLCLPSLSTRGTVDWGSDDERAIVRKYTIRRIDAAAGMLDIDFVLHEHGGPGSRFATTARMGETIGMIGPGGGTARAADWNLFVGDETAMPAIARLLETLPGRARGVALIEVADERDEQLFDHPDNLEVIWCHRRTAAHRNAFAERVASVTPPRDGSIFAWAGTEFAAFRQIRTDWRSAKGISREDHLAVAYWRQGDAQK